MLRIGQRTPGTLYASEHGSPDVSGAGFSQGSVAAALFLAEAFRQKRKLSLTFAILVSFLPLQS